MFISSTVYAAFALNQENKIQGYNANTPVVSVAGLPLGSAEQQLVKENSPSTTTGWSLTPAGKQLSLGSFPMGGVISPDRQFLIVSNDGAGTQSLQVIDLQQQKVVQTISYNAPEALYLGLAFSPDGSRLYASAGGNNKIRIYQFSGGQLKEGNPILVKDESKTSFYPAGITVSPDGKYLYTANNLNHSVSLINLTKGSISSTVPVGKRPYMPLLSRDGTTLYVSNWGESSVSVLDAKNLKLKSTIQVGLHPNAIVENPVNGFIYVANSDSDDLSIIDPSRMQMIRTISLAPYPGALTGTQPNALTVSADGKTLFVANAGNNDIEVIDITSSGKETRKGLIPTAWYPTGVFLNNDESTLIVLNAKGLGSGPNNDPIQWVGSMMTGTMSLIDMPSELQLENYSKQVQINNHMNFVEGDSSAKQENTSTFPIPSNLGQASPIKHVIYVIKENRTYDDIFGDLTKGDGNPSHVLFGKSLSPNHHKLAEQFVTLDHFSAVSEVSADGQNWSTAGKANDYVQKNWHANYSGRNRDYDFEGGGGGSDPSGAPFTRSESGYIWDIALKAGLTFRNYGQFMQNYNPVTKKFYPNDDKTTDFGGNYDPYYGGWDLSLSDMTRFQEWKKEFTQFKKNGKLPQLEIVYFPDDHTAGTFPGFRTPQAMMAANDLALGQLVDEVSHSPYWKDTAIFVVEDDAQSGVDHVDAHRTVALVISPYTQTGQLDSTSYDTTSMLRTMELILGLKPMTQFDASSVPMLNAFTQHPNFTAYNAETPNYPLDHLNGQDAPDAKISQGLDFTKPDSADRDKLNDAIWKTTNGAKPDPKKHN
jgi:YVTN family beta-propeller protein